MEEAAIKRFSKLDAIDPLHRRLIDIHTNYFVLHPGDFEVLVEIDKTDIRKMLTYAIDHWPENPLATIKMLAKKEKRQPGGQEFWQSLHNLYKGLVERKLIANTIKVVRDPVCNVKIDNLSEKEEIVYKTVCDLAELAFIIHYQIEFKKEEDIKKIEEIRNIFRYMPTNENIHAFLEKITQYTDSCPCSKS